MQRLISLLGGMALCTVGPAFGTVDLDGTMNSANDSQVFGVVSLAQVPGSLYLTLDFSDTNGLSGNIDKDAAFLAGTGSPTDLGGTIAGNVWRLEFRAVMDGQTAVDKFYVGMADDQGALGESGIDIGIQLSATANPADGRGVKLLSRGNPKIDWAPGGVSQDGKTERKYTLEVDETGPSPLVSMWVDDILFTNEVTFASFGSGERYVYYDVFDRAFNLSDITRGTVTSLTVENVGAPTNQPVILAFNASPASITTGETSTLSWQVTGADHITIAPEIGVVTGQSSVVVHPVSTTTYTLSAGNTWGTAEATAEVRVYDGSAPPNILFIAIDDMKPIAGHFLAEEPGNFLQRVYPDAALRSNVVERMTPNIDALARTGVSFMRGYCVTPACNPSRASLLTGIRSHVHGMTNNEGGIFFRDWVYPEGSGIQPLADAVTLPEYLKRHGWYTGETGKIFHSGGSRSGSDYPRSWTRWTNVGGNAGSKTRSAWSPSSLDWGQEGDNSARYTALNDYQTADFIATLLETGSNTNDADDFVLTGNEPFFIACGIFRPHLPFYATRDLLDLFPTNEMSITRTLLDEFIQDGDDLPPTGRSWSGTALDGGTGDPVLGSDRFVDILDHGKAVGGADGDLAGWQDMLKHYFASTAIADRSVGRLLEGLANSPYADNTIVILWSDHGYHLGEKLHETKFTLWEDAAQVQFIIRDPRRPQGAGVKCYRPVSLADLYPTVTAIAGLPLPPDPRITGHDLNPLLDHPYAYWNIPAHVTFGEVSHNMVAMERYKLIRYNHDINEAELYDLDTDPEEFDNLARVPGHEAVFSNMNALLEIALAEGTYPDEREASLPSFRKGYFGNSLNTGIGANTMDPESDRILNIMEFALTGNPVEVNDYPALSPRLVGKDNGSGVAYELTYQSSRETLRYEVEATPEINGQAFVPIWDSLATGAVEAVTAVDHGDGTRTLRIPAENGEPIRTLRLSVEEVE